MSEDSQDYGTYWDGRGKHKPVIHELDKLIPIKGSVEHSRKNKSLEKYRIAMNCYYDMYNNDLGNRAAEFRTVYGFAGVKARKMFGKQRLFDMTEERFNVIIEAAAKEQGLESYLSVSKETA